MPTGTVRSQGSLMLRGCVVLEDWERFGGGATLRGGALFRTLSTCGWQEGRN